MINYSSLPSTIDVAHARLPANYERAKSALAECVAVDECKSWGDKAAALASYAKQADDDELYKQARRVQGLAVQRCGELLKEYDATGRNQHSEDSGGNPTKLSQREVADAAGLSKDQQVTAVRVANVPEQRFREELEAGTSITKIAEIGKKAGAPGTAGFREATELLGTLKRFADYCETNAPEYVAGGMNPRETREASANAARVVSWLSKFVGSLKD